MCSIPRPLIPRAGQIRSCNGAGWLVGRLEAWQARMASAPRGWQWHGVAPTHPYPHHPKMARPPARRRPTRLAIRQLGLNMMGGGEQQHLAWGGGRGGGGGGVSAAVAVVEDEQGPLPARPGSERPTPRRSRAEQGSRCLPADRAPMRMLQRRCRRCRTHHRDQFPKRRAPLLHSGLRASSGPSLSAGPCPHTARATVNNTYN